MRNWTALAGWLVIVGAVAWAVKVTEPHPADDEPAREHPSVDDEWEQHIATLPRRQLQCPNCGWWTDNLRAHVEELCTGLSDSSLHSATCPCTICTTYQPHEITGNWHPSKGPRTGLYLAREEPRAHDH